MILKSKLIIYNGYMAKVKFPLFSGEAYGKFGNFVIYQGQTVKSYAEPRNPRTPSQVAVRDLFHDITKMVKAANTWARAAWYTAFGDRWFTGIYSRIKANQAEWWEYAYAEWEAFAIENQTAWRNAAPYQGTVEDAGLVFWVVIYTTVNWLIELGAPTFEADEWGEHDSADAAAWYALGLDETLTKGVYDDDNGQITYTGTWTPITDASAYGGGYQESPATGSPGFAFYFYGTQFILKFTKDTDYGSMEVNTFSMTEQVVSQNNDPIQYQQGWTSPILGKGLHLVLVARTGTGSISLDGVEISNAKSQAPYESTLPEALQLIGCKVTRDSNFSVTGNNTWQSIPWTVEVWTENLMHSVAVDPERVYCRVSGKYLVMATLNWQFVQLVEHSTRVLKNGTDEVDYFSNSNSIYHQPPDWHRIFTAVDLEAGDYLTLEVKLASGAAKNVLYEAGRSPIFTVQKQTWSALRVQG